MAVTGQIAGSFLSVSAHLGHYEHSKQNGLQDGKNVRNGMMATNPKSFISVIRKESRNAIVNNSSNPAFSMVFFGWSGVKCVNFVARKLPLRSRRIL